MMLVIQQVFAAIGLVVCLVLLLRLALPLPRRFAFDAAARRRWQGLVHFFRGARHWRPTSRKQAARVAEEAIERARRVQTEREGNVYRPKSFGKGPRKPH